MRLQKIILAALLLLAVSAPAKAHDGLGGLGLAYLFGYNASSAGSTSYNHNVPYFALHPPVYYGQRYARPFGVSPYASWPQLSANPGYAPVMIDDDRLPRPLVIEIPQGGSAPKSSEMVKKPVGPLVLENPYYKSEVRYRAKEK
ncbi:MAG: hypothetical protein AAF483_02455 [Planctomycetota bacterium]